jgi:UDP-N-acetylglucosamine diphosphorylase/glucosamine-1-phosphate N-acetyltransferase
LTRNKNSARLDASNTIIGDRKEFFCEPGASVSGATINVDSGPVYIGKDVTILEGCLIRGPVAICEGAVLKMGAKIYGPSVIGPFAKVGGEINHSTIFGNSNKAHDGYLGNSIIGEWCNLGAGTNVSNLKNTYKDVHMWSYVQRNYEDSGQLFLGVVIGDHTKCGISTMLNTGTVIGVSANVFGAGFPKTFVPSFAWGGAESMDTYRLDKAIETAARVMARRGVELDDDDKDIFSYIFNNSAEWRAWEHP